MRSRLIPSPLAVISVLVEHFPQKLVCGDPHCASSRVGSRITIARVVVFALTSILALRTKYVLAPRLHFRDPCPAHSYTPLSVAMTTADVVARVPRLVALARAPPRDAAVRGGARAPRSAVTGLLRRVALLRLRAVRAPPSRPLHPRLLLPHTRPTRLRTHQRHPSMCSNERGRWRNEFYMTRGKDELPTL